MSRRKHCGRCARRVFLAGPGEAKDYPTHPITLVVPFPAGGGVDAVGAHRCGETPTALGQQVVIDNRAGAPASSARAR